MKLRGLRAACCRCPAKQPAAGRIAFLKILNDPALKTPEGLHRSPSRPKGERPSSLTLRCLATAVTFDVLRSAPTTRGSSMCSESAIRALISRSCPKTHSAAQPLPPPWEARPPFRPATVSPQLASYTATGSRSYGAPNLLLPLSAATSPADPHTSFRIWEHLRGSQARTQTNRPQCTLANGNPFPECDSQPT